MRRFAGMLCAGALAVSMLTGCAGGSGPETTEAHRESEAETGNTSSAAETTPEETTQEDTTQAEMKHEMRDIPSTELVKEMNIGWNFGNALDSISDTLSITDPATSFETAWGAPPASQVMIDAVLEAGFNVVRIPCSWKNHIYDDGEYTIESTWMDRVQEVVDFAYGKGAYVILNLHHEDWNYPYYDNKEAGAKELKAVWTQIGERFADYGDHLIFEGMNEPRKVGTGAEWTGDAEGREVVQYFDEVFIDTIRGLGGNNAKRHLMIPGYAASSNLDNLQAIQVPEGDDKIIVSVHAYIPYNFALNTGAGSVADWNHDTRDIDNLMKNLNELFISKGTPVIIGEFGAVDRENDAQRSEWVSYYVTEARKLGITCCWWDNHTFSGDGERFGMLKAMGFNMKWAYPDLLEAMMDAAYDK